VCEEESALSSAPAPSTVEEPEDLPRGQDSFLTRWVRTLAYYPFEDDHADESTLLPWLFVICCLVVGVAASFANLWFGIALAVLPLHGTALLRWLVTR
jgi:hypothetical protein